MAENTLTKIMNYVVLVLQPLVDEVNTPQGAVELFNRLGIALPSAPVQSVAHLAQAIESLVQALTDLETEIAANGESSQQAMNKLMALSVASATTLAAVLDLAPKLQDEFNAYPDFLNSIDLAQVGRKLLDELVIQFVATEFTAVHNLLVLIGLFELANESPYPQPAAQANTIDYGPDLTQPELPSFKEAYQRRTIRYDRIKQIFQAPDAVARDLYGWGTDRFDADRVLRLLQFIGWSLNCHADFHPSAPLDPGAETTSEELRYRIQSVLDENGSLEFGLAVLPVPPTPAGSDAGLGLRPYGAGDLGLTIAFSPNWSLGLHSPLDLSSGLALLLRPPFNPEISLQAGSLVYKVDADLTYGAAEGTRPKLLSIPDWLKLDMAGLTFGLGVSGDTQGKFEFHVEGKLNDGALLLTAGEGDSFLQKVLPPDGLKAVFDLGVGWSSQRGLYFTGSGGFEITLPVHLDLFGVLTIDSIYVGAFAKEGEIKTNLAMSASLSLGPIQASVERIGASVVITFPDGGGNVGWANAEFKFKPPNGLGMAIDASVVVGGGYLFFDTDNEKYAGVLQLSIADVVSVTAIGLLTTRMPDGTKGFSLLVILCAEFPPIQLGFGFTLNGLGGLLGVNRTMVLDALRAGVKNRTLNSVLFPQDPIANAPKIISDLSTIYPPAQGRYVFGPMVMLGWGSPDPLIKIELGIVLEIPSPIRLAILGRITVALPNEKAALVLIHLDILGAIDFDKCDASIDATLYDSQVVQFTITGDMALRLNWGEHPVFMVSVGGFNPHYTPPPDLPALERLAISLATGDNPRLRLEAYMAVTSNTVQFGARLDVYAGVSLGMLGTFSVQANFSLDAIVQFSPFWFEIDIAANAGIYHNDDVLLGVHLAFSLSGPEPWHAWGDATFSFLGKHTIAFDFTISGDQPAPPALPPADPLPVLLEALRDPRNWSAQLPGTAGMLVSLRKIEVGGDVLAHPFGRLTVRQKIVPLEVSIQKFGAASLAAPTTYSVASVRVVRGEQSDPAFWSGQAEEFAPAQFVEMSDDEKLSRPAFESFPAGCTDIGTVAVKYDSRLNVATDFGYETVLIDAKDVPRPNAKTRGEDGANTYRLATGLMEALALRGAAGRSPLKNRGSARFAGPKQALGIQEPAFVVASTRDLGAAAGAPFQTYTQAKIRRQSLGADQRQWQVVGSHEVKP